MRRSRPPGRWPPPRTRSAGASSCWPRPWRWLLRGRRCRSSCRRRCRRHRPRGRRPRRRRLPAGAVGRAAPPTRADGEVKRAGSTEGWAGGIQRSWAGGIQRSWERRRREARCSGVSSAAWEAATNSRRPVYSCDRSLVPAASPTLSELTACPVLAPSHPPESPRPQGREPASARGGASGARS